MKSFGISTIRHTVDEKNMVRALRGKLVIRAEDASDAIFKAKEWLAENTEKGHDFEVLSASGSRIREIVADSKGATYYEVTVEFIPDNKEKKGKRVTVIVISDTCAHASTKAHVYMGEKQPVKVVACKESQFEDFVGFEKSEE